MSSGAATSSDASDNRMPSNPPSHNHRFITKVPGRLIHPLKLAEMVKIRSNNNYTIEMRNDTYTIYAPFKITWDDIKGCY
ncbi:hypothetical protein GGS24DRAFT_458014 [Hypoxylon argillaceum]|nr:hypothetical protein GGS24DRAFT_458014 [Hypoxylon argillaceum]